MIQSMLRDLEVAATKCYKVITITTGATVTSLQKVILLDGSVVRADFTNNTISAIAPTVGAGQALVECAADKDKEIQNLCEFTTAGVYVDSFIRVFTFDSAGNAVTADFALNGTTPYVVTSGNVVKPCGEASVTLSTFAVVATNAAPVTIPANVKSFSVLNLTTGIAVAITGGLVDTIAANSVEAGFVYSVSEDQDALSGAVVVTPATGGSVKVRRTI